ncbi:MAG: eukaryotic-like serine/threonine-protein kinase [Solirubrobacteraceae bacterium]|nr:eukaryotic-like serine/threonine-protein kinase [Solirubrobacteraceae bacterium]
MTERLANRYELGERLGAGGMSTVVLALDVRLERHVAVKLLAEHLADDPNFVSRFQREALAAARLVHPNIVQVFDSGLDAASGRHYIVMEYVPGPSGAALLRDQGRLSVAETVDIVVQACQGLDYAHRNGVVHRDVKPGNLLRSDDGQMKLADFGIAKAAEQTSITQVGAILGTAAYLAPEQARGEEAGPPADLYSLGVVTYQFLTGELPYPASSLTELAFMQMRERPPLLNEVDPTIPSSLALAVDRALAIEPAERYESAREMGDVMEAAAAGVAPPPATAATGVVSRTDELPSVEPATGATRAMPRQQARPRQPRPGPPRQRQAPPPPPPRSGGGGRRALAVMLIALFAAAGAAAAVVATSSSTRKVHVRQVTGRDTNEIVSSLQRLIEDNTR